MRRSTILAILGLSALAPAQTLVGSVSGGGLQHCGAALASAGFSDADTYADLLVGLPNGGSGEIRCISGLWLATGQGTSVLWSVTGGSFIGTNFGASLAAVGNLTGDSAGDFVVGVPGYRTNPFSGIDNGALMLVDGTTHTIAATIYGDINTRLGTVVVSVSDQNGDGKAEVAATAPSTNTTDASWVHIFSGSTFSGTKSLAASVHSSLNSNGSNVFGTTLASGFDLDGNGKRDLAIGSPLMFGNGWVYIVSADNQFTTLAAYSSGSANERMGASISGTHDYNGDGVVDFIVGAPNWSAGVNTQEGRAVVLSGAALRSYTLPYELATLTYATGVSSSPLHFGAAVRASPDLNRDGIGDFLIGMPDWFAPGPIGQSKGAALVYSGATLARMGSCVGATNDRLGDVLLGALQDVDGDLYPEFVVAGSTSDSAGADSGVVKLYRLFPSNPSYYCTAKTNSLGCVPNILWSGTGPGATASGATSFSLTCGQVINQTAGLFMYSHAPSTAPFQGGTLCVKTPLRRTSVLTSGGSSSGVDCTGVFSYDFGARITSGVDPTLVLGAQIFAQCWSRDSASPSTTSLSNAINFLINP